MFVRNAWYVAAWSSEIGTALTAVRMLDEAIVLTRMSDGRIAALEDACPHRKLPLSMGRRKGDTVECGYHGLTFDSSGACTRVPGAERVPHRARVHAYPVVERYGLIWLWMGDPALADPELVFEVAHWGNPAWGVNAGDAMEVDSNYLYLTDNLLDPSHVAWVHPTSFGNAACEETPLETTLTDTGVIVWRWMKGVEPAPFYKQFLRFDGPCDRKQHYEVCMPGHAIIRAIFVPARTGGEGRDLPPETFIMDSFNFMTPVDASSTRYFWFQMRNFAPGDAEVSALFAKSVRGAFEEDRVVLEAVQRGMDSMRTPHIDLGIDSGPKRFRQMVARRLSEERPGREAAE
ncbi:MAG: aromatic ring-hydroxylating dioxygenase subunit alpha [Rhodobacteraceae bacterium]|nr:aromatic ring-hydroxylating dioxygenase subunit alpha [Paracoccaceae bacterium]